MLLLYDPWFTYNTVLCYVTWIGVVYYARVLLCLGIYMVQLLPDTLIVQWLTFH